MNALQPIVAALLTVVALQSKAVTPDLNYVSLLALRTQTTDVPNNLKCYIYFSPVSGACSNSDIPGIPGIQYNTFSKSPDPLIANAVSFGEPGAVIASSHIVASPLASKPYGEPFAAAYSTFSDAFIITGPANSTVDFTVKGSFHSSTKWIGGLPGKIVTGAQGLGPNLLSQLVAYRKDGTYSIASENILTSNWASDTDHLDSDRQWEIRLSAEAGSLVTLALHVSSYLAVDSFVYNLCRPGCVAELNSYGKASIDSILLSIPGAKLQSASGLIQEVSADKWIYTTSVPEPASALLLTLGCSIVLLTRMKIPRS